jgi:hypothetical protein
MMMLFWLVFWAGLAALTLAAGVTMHTRRKEAIAADVIVVDDSVIERIIETGEIFVEESEPLDLNEIDEEEERFWSETWDEPTGEW